MDGITREDMLEMARKALWGRNGPPLHSFRGPDLRDIERVADEMQYIQNLENERCALIADSAKPTGPDPIGPLHGAGICAAAEWIANKIRGAQE